MELYGAIMYLSPNGAWSQSPTGDLRIIGIIGIVGIHSSSFSCPALSCPFPATRLLITYLIQETDCTHSRLIELIRISIVRLQLRPKHILFFHFPSLPFPSLSKYTTHDTSTLCSRICIYRPSPISHLCLSLFLSDIKINQLCFTNASHPSILLIRREETGTHVLYIHSCRHLWFFHW